MTANRRHRVSDGLTRHSRRVHVVGARKKRVHERSACAGAPGCGVHRVGCAVGCLERHFRGSTLTSSSLLLAESRSSPSSSSDPFSTVDSARDAAAAACRRGRARASPRPPPAPAEACISSAGRSKASGESPSRGPVPSGTEPPSDIHPIAGDPPVAIAQAGDGGRAVRAAGAGHTSEFRKAMRCHVAHPARLALEDHLQQFTICVSFLLLSCLKQLLDHRKLY